MTGSSEGRLAAAKGSGFMMAATLLGALGLIEIAAFAPAAGWLSLRVWLLQAVTTGLILILVWSLAIGFSRVTCRLSRRSLSAAETGLCLCAAMSGTVHGWGLIAHRTGRIAAWFPRWAGLLGLGASIAVAAFFTLRFVRTRLGLNHKQTILFFTAVLAVPILSAAALTTVVTASDGRGLRTYVGICGVSFLILVLGATLWGGRRRGIILTTLTVLAILFLRMVTDNRHDWRVLGKVHASRVQGPPVLLVVLDTFRADALDLSDPAQSSTPNIARLARESNVYPHAVANASWTLPGHASIFTGRFLFQHRTDLTSEPGFGFQLDPAISTAHALFESAGYHTVCVAANRLVGPDTGLVRGCQRYRNPGSAWVEHLLPLKLVMILRSERFPLLRQVVVDLMGVNYNARAHEIVDIAQGQLPDGPAPPLYLFLNFMDVHQPLTPAPGVTLQQRARFTLDNLLMLTGVRPFEIETLSRRHASTLRAYYASGVADLDREIGRLMKTLRERGLYDRMLIVLTADHGHAFSENTRLPGYFDHQGGYEPVVRVPLLVKRPGQKAGTVFENMVQQVDILPTLLSLAQLSSPPDIPGRQLGASSDELVLTEWYPRLNGRKSFLPYRRIGVYRGEFKYVLETPGEHLYDLDRGPYESVDVISERPDLAARLRLQLSVLQSQTAPPSRGAIDDETLEQFRSLGYVK